MVQKLIETVKTRQQISLVISALEPGFLALIKDLNGNHVVQRCLQCFTTEDSKVIHILLIRSLCISFHDLGGVYKPYKNGRITYLVIFRSSFSQLLKIIDSRSYYLCLQIIDLEAIIVFANTSVDLHFNMFVCIAIISGMLEITIIVWVHAIAFILSKFPLRHMFYVACFQHYFEIIYSLLAS